MPTARLIPSTYYLSNSSYLSVSNADRLYNNTDNTTYATVTNSQTGTSSYYIYLRGFNFDAIDSAWVVNSFTVKLKAYESGVSTSSSYVPYLCNNTTTLSGCTTTAISTTASVHTFTCTLDWDTIKGYGSNFGIRINCRRSSRNTTGYMYIYGAEIEVDYTIPVPCTITSSLTGGGTISPSGAYSTYEDTEYTLTITPANTSDTVTATKNGMGITSSLVAHYPGGTLNTVLGTYSLVSGGFNGSGASYFQGIVGNGVDAAQTTSNYYSSGSGTTAVFQYSMAFSNIPANATIERVYCMVNGHAESTSNASEYMCVQLKSGSTELSEEINFKSIGTSNTTITLEATTIPTAAQLQSMVLECTLGYYGGAINGATCYVVYSVPADHPSYYTYTYVTDGDATIAVVISGAGRAPVITIGTPSTAIISDETGYDECICTFTADVALQAWEARATKSGVTPARGVGLLVESGGSLAAGTASTVSVVDEELTDGDGDYTITVYGQSTGGVWSE